MTEMTFKILSADSTEKQLSLFNTVFSKNFNHSDWNKKHFESPRGHTIFIGAFDGDRLAGFNGFMPAEYISNGSVYSAAQSCESAVHPDYRGRGIFSKLILKGHEVLRDRGFDLIFGYPNKNSLPGFLKLKWIEVGSLTCQLIPLKTSDYIAERFGILAKPLGIIFDRYSSLKLHFALQSNRAVPALDRTTSFDGFNLTSDDRDWRFKTSNAKMIDVEDSRGGRVTYFAVKQTRNGGALVWDKFSNQSNQTDPSAAIRALIQLQRSGWRFANLWSSNQDSLEIQEVGIKVGDSKISLLAFPLTEKSENLLKTCMLRPDFFDVDTFLVSES